MIQELTIKGQSGRAYRAVASTGKLSRPLIDYFPNRDVDYWFKLGESARKELLRAVWPDYRWCAVTGKWGTDLHEIEFKGMGKKWMTLVPWNIIPVSRNPHMMLQARQWYVVQWDPLARNLEIRTRDGLLVRNWWNLPQMEREKKRGIPVSL